MTPEPEIALAILQIAATKPQGIATFDQLRAEIPNKITLDTEDLSDSQTRVGEPMWHQIMRNVQSHHESDENFIALGLLIHIDRTGYQVTDLGRQHLSKYIN